MSKQVAPQDHTTLYTLTGTLSQCSKHLNQVLNKNSIQNSVYYWNIWISTKYYRELYKYQLSILFSSLRLWSDPNVWLPGGNLLDNVFREQLGSFILRDGRQYHTLSTTLYEQWIKDKMELAFWKP